MHSCIIRTRVLELQKSEKRCVLYSEKYGIMCLSMVTKYCIFGPQFYQSLNKKVSSRTLAQSELGLFFTRQYCNCSHKNTSGDRVTTSGQNLLKKLFPNYLVLTTSSTVPKLRHDYVSRIY